MNPSIAAQFRWGNLTMLDIYYKPLMIRNPDGTEYVGDNRGGPRVMLLRCDCGHEWEVPVKTFPGRRKLRSCMRPECAFTPRPKPKLFRLHGATYSMYLTEDVV